MGSTRIVELANLIQDNTVKVDAYLRSKGLPTPSFDEDGPVDLGIESEEIRKAVDVTRESSLELHDLLLGPGLSLRPVLNGVSLQAMYKYDIARKVPLHGETTYEELARACGLDEVNLRRFLRFAMTFHHVFQEPRKGIVRHSAASRKLVEDPVAYAGLGYMFDEVWQSFAYTIEAMETFKENKPNESGWSLSRKTDKPVWEYYASHPDSASRFSKAMSALSSGSGRSPSFLVKGYPWSSLCNASGTATVVDVGGSKGQVSAMLAQSTPGLQVVVQDLPEAIQGWENATPNDLKQRLKFMTHDFFDAQSVEADAYLFRNIFHNWSDAHVVRILKATVPALKPGAHIIVNDFVIPEPNTLPWTEERSVRYKSMDLIMLSLFNAREREEAEWRALFKQADERFTDIQIWVPSGATMAIIEARWETSS